MSQSPVQQRAFAMLLRAARTPAEYQHKGEKNMKYGWAIAVMVVLFSFAACDRDTDDQPGMHDMHGGQAMGESNGMGRIHLLLDYALMSAVQSGVLRLQGDDGAELLAKQSADMLRRAMSGPEMSAMHRGDGMPSASMQATHDLGDALFAWLDQMMRLSPQAGSEESIRPILNALQLAAEGASLCQLGQMPHVLAADFNGTVILLGEQQLAHALQLLDKEAASDLRAQAVAIVQRLQAMQSDRASDPTMHH